MEIRCVRCHKLLSPAELEPRSTLMLKMCGICWYLEYVTPGKPFPKVRPAWLLNDGRFTRRLAYITSETDCWIWGSTCMKRTRSDGSIHKIPMFPMIMENTRKTKNVYARRFAWERHNQYPIPPGYCIINVCGEELCVKPDEKHNVMDKLGAWTAEAFNKRIP